MSKANQLYNQILKYPGHINLVICIVKKFSTNIYKNIFRLLSILKLNALLLYTYSFHVRRSIHLIVELRRYAFQHSSNV